MFLRRNSLLPNFTFSSGFLLSSRRQMKFHSGANKSRTDGLYFRINSYRFSYSSPNAPRPVLRPSSVLASTLKRAAILYFDGIPTESPSDRFCLTRPSTSRLNLTRRQESWRDIVFISNHLATRLAVPFTSFPREKPESERSVFYLGKRRRGVPPGILLLRSISISLHREGYRLSLCPSFTLSLYLARPLSRPAVSAFPSASTAGANKQGRCREHETTYPFYRSKYARDLYARMPFSARFLPLLGLLFLLLIHTATFSLRITSSRRDGENINLGVAARKHITNVTALASQPLLHSTRIILGLRRA